MRSSHRERGQLAAVSHVDPEKVKWAWELKRQTPLNMDAPTGVPEVIRTGRSELREVVTDELLQAAARTSEELSLMREIGFSSVIIVPLIARDQVLGAMTLVWAESGRTYDGDDLALAEELAAAWLWRSTTHACTRRRRKRTPPSELRMAAQSAFRGSRNVSRRR